MNFYKIKLLLMSGMFLFIPFFVFAQSVPSNETIQGLINDLASPVKDRLITKQALMNIGEPVVDLLIVNLNSQSYIIRNNVADVLGSMKSVRAITYTKVLRIWVGG